MRAPTFGDTVAAELAKLRTSRAARRNLVLGTVLSVALAALLAAVFGATYDELSVAEQADFDPVLWPLTGSVLAAIFYVAVGVNVVASEYTSGMMRLTLTATPRRWRVVGAKALAVAIATWVAGGIASVGMLVPSQFIFRAFDAPSAGFGDGSLWRVLLAMVATGPLFPVLGAVFGFVFRSTAAAITSVLVLLFAPSIVGALLPSWWQRNVISLLPGPASDSVVIAHLDDAELYLHPVVGALVTFGWIAAALWLAGTVLARRDA